MKLPEHMTITLDDQDKADLRAAQTSFQKSMAGLSGKEQLARARVIAGGIREADPFTRAMAKQVVDAAAHRSEIETLKAELAQTERDLRVGGYKPRDPHWRGKALQRQEDLRARIGHAHARLVGIAEDTLATAQKKAAVHFRQARQQAAHAAAVKEAIARAEARLDAEAIDRQAEAIAKSRRMASGRSLASEDHRWARLNDDR